MRTVQLLNKMPFPFHLVEFRNQRLADHKRATQLHTPMDYLMAASHQWGRPCCGLTKEKMETAVFASYAVASYWLIEPTEMFTRSKGVQAVCGARMQSISIAAQIGELRACELSRFFAREHNSVRHALKHIERTRERSQDFADITDHLALTADEMLRLRCVIKDLESGPTKAVA